ncbi:MAG TPA: transglutaminase family protein [Steroidobacteraceae bacterium]|jgi:transglutaminase-like putative cysteine protease|nr:transglutaminase family protein [Steroidobacteraceae bacterium]
MSAVRYAVRHETCYRYGREVAHSHQLLHLTPRDCARQQCLEHRLLIEPQPAVRSEHVDAFGNRVTRVELDRPHDQLSVLADMVVSLEAAPEPPLDEGEGWETVRDGLSYQAEPSAPEWLEAMRFRGESPFVRIKRLFSDFARDCLAPKRSVLEVAACLMSKVHAEFTYAPGETEIATPLLEVFHKRRGVCQDYAHFMIACLRSAGLAARYVSGYLRTHALEGESESSADDLLGADASHAWVAVFAPPLGWIEFDPTNNVRVRQEHVMLGWGRDFGDVSPLRGVILGGGSHALSVRVAVQALSVQQTD